MTPTNQTTTTNGIRSLLKGFSLNGQAQIPASDAQPTPAPEGVTVQRVNLKDYGFEQAGHNNGDPLAFRNFCHKIEGGYIIDENANEARVGERRAQIDSTITDLRKQCEGLQADRRKVNETDVPKLRREVALLQEDLDDNRRQALQPLRPDQRNRFNLVLYWAIFVPATVAMSAFYVSSAYAALVRNVAQELRQGEVSAAEVALGGIFQKQALYTSGFHWAMPVFYFLCAAVLHIYWQKTGWQRRVGLALIILFTVLFDGLMAYLVEARQYEIRVMTQPDDPNHRFWAEPLFWMIFCLGCVVSLLWGVLLHTLQEEYAKQDWRKQLDLTYRQLRDKKLALEHALEDLKAQAIAIQGRIDQLLLDIEQLQADRERVSLNVSELEKYLSDFYAGWLQFLNGKANSQADKETCEAIMHTFRRVRPA